MTPGSLMIIEDTPTLGQYDVDKKTIKDCALFITILLLTDTLIFKIYQLHKRINTKDDECEENTKMKQQDKIQLQ